MSSHTIHIVILSCEVPVPPVLSQRGTFGTIFHNLLRTSASGVSPHLTIQSTEYNVLKGEYPTDLSLVDVILVTGSASAAYDTEDWIQKLDRYISDTYTNHPRIKMLGICFGHQIICQSLLRQYGVRVEKDPKGFENGVHAVALTNEFREALGWKLREAVIDSTEVPESLRLQFIHGDHVRFPVPNDVPRTWLNVGSTQHCASQGVYQPLRVLTLQGHFEFDRFINSETLKQAAVELHWSEGALQNYLRAADGDDDSKWAAEMVVRFFLEESAK